MGTDLNDIAVTKDGQIAISGDDRATIRITNYPATRQEPSTEYTNHAEFVVAVKLLVDDSQLISCGGADRAVFQWILHKNYEHKAIEIEEEVQEEMKVDPEERIVENVDSGPEVQLEPEPKSEPEPEPEPKDEPEMEPEREPVVEPKDSNPTTSDEDGFPEFNEQWLQKHKLLNIGHCLMLKDMTILRLSALSTMRIWRSWESAKTGIVRSCCSESNAR